MPGLANCPHCARSLSVPEQALGKSVRCPRCREIFVVPAAPPDAEPASLSLEPDLKTAVARFGVAACKNTKCSPVALKKRLGHA